MLVKTVLVYVLFIKFTNVKKCLSRNILFLLVTDDPSRCQVSKRTSSISATLTNHLKFYIVKVIMQL